VEPEDFTVEGKSGSWVVTRNGKFVLRFSTKAKANHFIESMVKNNDLKVNEWQEQYGWTRHKQEGTDFRYSK
jgi:hypothetical protein